MNVSENQTVALKIVPPDISFEKALETFAPSADQSGRTWDWQTKKMITDKWSRPCLAAKPQSIVTK